MQHLPAFGRQRLATSLAVLVTVGVALSSRAQPTNSDGAQSDATATPLVIASKKFPESALLAEMLAQVVETEGGRVERRTNMGNTAIVFAALDSGAVDAYPDYTGTLLAFVGVRAPTTSPAPPSDATPRRAGTSSHVARNAVTPQRAHAAASQALWSKHGLQLGPALGFANSYALAVRGALARQHALETITDLSKLDDELRTAFTHEFLVRKDGWPGLAHAYGLSLGPRGVEHGVAYELIAQGQLDVTDVYTTEGLIARHDIVVLEDDAGYFPPYDAAFVYSRRASRSLPFLRAQLRLAGQLTTAKMRELNSQVEMRGHAVQQVARNFIVENLPVPGTRADGTSASGSGVTSAERTTAVAPTGASEGFARAGFWHLVVTEWRSIADKTIEHLVLVGVALLLTTGFGVPLGFACTRRRWLGRAIVGVSGALQTIPSLALLVFAVPLTAFAFGWIDLERYVMEGAAILALFLYGLLPVVHNTKAGVEGVSRAAIDAASGLGMTPRQLFFQVTLPLAAPVVIAGIRTASVIAVGSATLAALIGAGGLGEPIISGLAVQDYARVWTGAVPAALLALAVDAAFALAQRRLSPIPPIAT